MTGPLGFLGNTKTTSTNKGALGGGGWGDVTIIQSRVLVTVPQL